MTRHSTRDEIKSYAQFPFGLREFLRSPISLDGARQYVRDNLERRNENFLAILERQVYGNPTSPYRTLLCWANCELGDVRAMVHDKGLEETLRQLRAAGVYVSFEEAKGRVPIVRDGKTLAVRDGDFDHTEGKRVFSTTTGGSTGKPEEFHTDFQRIRAGAPYHLLAKSAYGLVGAPEITWRGIIPDATFSAMLQRTLVGQRTLEWYSQIGWRSSKYWLKYDAATLYMLFWMKVLGTQVPFPRFVPLEKSAVIAHALGDALKKYERCSFHSDVSRALRVCLSATEAGIDLTGLAVFAGGEPPTRAKVNEIVRTGARFFPVYASSGTGVIGHGCAGALDSSDVHLYTDICAIITYPHRVEGFDVSVPAFHLTGLANNFGKVYLNTQLDDYGIVQERDCGCELGTYGYRTHIRDIRSFRKMTGEGVTLIGSELLMLIEQVLPARFGGTPLDYQLMEQEEDRGLTRIYLIIHPRIEIADEQQVIEVVLTALRNTSPAADAARTIWQQSGSLRIKRTEPVWSARGKLMPLHIERNQTSSVKETPE